MKASKWSRHRNSKDRRFRKYCRRLYSTVSGVANPCMDGISTADVAMQASLYINDLLERRARIKKEIEELLIETASLEIGLEGHTPGGS